MQTHDGPEWAVRLADLDNTGKLIEVYAILPCGSIDEKDELIWLRVRQAPEWHPPHQVQPIAHGFGQPLILVGVRHHHRSLPAHSFTVRRLPVVIEGDAADAVDHHVAGTEQAQVDVDVEQDLFHRSL